MKTFTQIQIRDELLKSVVGNEWSVQRYQQLLNAFRKRESSLVADSLLDIIASMDGEDGYAIQDLAGKLLLELNPHPSHTLPDIVRSILPAWNKSVEEIPWYLALHYGEEALCACVALAVKGGDERLRDQARTFEWWLGAREYRTMRDAGCIE
jgi:hypothetical protein